MIVGELSTEHLMTLRKFDRRIETRLGNPHRLGSDSYPPAIESMHGNLEALSFLAQQVRCRNPQILEYELNGIRGANPKFLLLLSDRETWHRTLDNECVDPLRAKRWVNGGKSDDDASMGSIGDPCLGTVEYPIISITSTGRLDRNRIGAMVWLGDGIRS